MTAHKRKDRISQWAVQLRARVGWQQAVVALANKHARIVWALLAKGRTGRQQISSTNWLSRHPWRRRYPNGALR